MRLWLFLTLLVNALVVAAFAGFGAYTVGAQLGVLQASITAESQRTAKVIAQSLTEDLLLKAYDKVDQRLLIGVGLARFTELVLLDQNKQMISQVRLDDQGRALRVYDLKPQALDLSERTWFADGSLKVRVPVEIDTALGTEQLAWLTGTVILGRLEQTRDQIWTATWRAAALTVTLVTLVMALVIGRIGRRMHRIRALADALGEEGAVPTHERYFIAELDAIDGSLSRASAALRTQFQALIDSEARKAAILEASLDCMITIDSEGRVVDYNPAAVETFGWAREEVLDADLSGLILPERYRAAHQKGLQHYLKTGEGPVLRKRIEVTALHRSGREIPVELAVVPFKSGQSEFFLGSLRDISARVEMDAERQRVNAMLQQAVDDAAVRQFALDQHAIVSISDSQGTIVYANDKLVDISKYAIHELLGQNHSILSSGEHDARFFQDMWTTITSGSVWHGEICNRAKDGQTYWVSATIVPIKDDAGLPYQYIAVRTDITEIKRIERQLDMSTKSLGKLVDRYRIAQEEVMAAQRRELELGHQIQRSMLFGNLPARFGSVSLAAFSEPSKGIDGDFFDFMALGTSQFDVVIGDVMGKGVAAALIGAAVKQSLHQVVAEKVALASLNERAHPDPASIMNGVHDKLVHQLVELESFVTLAYLRVDLAANLVSFVDAGHTQFLHIRKGQARVVSGVNLPLGVLADEVYESHSFEIEAGDFLFLYSDGFTEARNEHGDEFGLDALSQLVTTLHLAQVPLSTMVQCVRAEVHAFEGKVIPSDDRTCILMRVEEPLRAGQTLEWHEYDLPWTLNSLTQLRLYVEDAALKVGMKDEARDALILAVYEAATNLIRHAEQPGVQASVGVRLADTGAFLEVSFFYLGEPFVDVQREPDFSGDSEGGFGLYIIRNSVDEVRYDSPAQGVARVFLKKAKRLNTSPASGVPS